MERIVVVGVVPVDRARRDVAALVHARESIERLVDGVLYLWLAGMEFAVGGDDIDATIGDQELRQRRVGIVADRADDKSRRIGVPHAGCLQLFLYRREEIDKGVPGLRHVGNLVAGLFDQRAPDMERGHRTGMGDAVEAAPLLDAVIQEGVGEHGRVHLRLLRLDDVGHVDEIALPGLKRGSLGRGYAHRVGHLTAGDRRDDLLPQRRERRDGQLDQVAARFFVIRDDLADRRVLLGDKALRPPQCRGGGRRVGDVGPREASRRQPQ